MNPVSVPQLKNFGKQVLIWYGIVKLLNFHQDLLPVTRVWIRLRHREVGCNMIYLVLLDYLRRNVKILIDFSFLCCLLFCLIFWGLKSFIYYWTLLFFFCLNRCIYPLGLHYFSTSLHFGLLIGAHSLYWVFFSFRSWSLWLVCFCWLVYVFGWLTATHC